MIMLKYKADRFFALMESHGTIILHELVIRVGRAKHLTCLWVICRQNKTYRSIDIYGYGSRGIPMRSIYSRVKGQMK